MLMTPIRPIYPAIAKAAESQGTSSSRRSSRRAGTIESLTSSADHEMLRSAALDAIRAARYQPYLLNGEPTEVQTTFTVNFTMGV